ncbi:GntR family transcriptional regulator [Rhizomonospora bruguierae]|uniref:GntR family transcriptional regulator n=1 Tax=Rhizomonospora bruguierae TaxID=1581705 RepID=UPI001BCD3CDE|nr:GntR family transcriptional regulator [Micromonospora sp. NBRC 107566]
MSPAPGQPRYRAIAAELRARIEDGRLAPGAPLPTENALMGEFGVSRGTVREAIAVLRSDGLVVTTHGRGTHVRAVGPTAPGDGIYRQRRDGIAGEAEGSRRAEKLLGTAQVAVEHAEVPATETLAELLGVEPGTPVLRRRVRLESAGAARRLSDSYYRADVADAGLTDPAYEPLARLEAAGETITRVREVVRSRMPTLDESDALALGPDVPVLVVTRQSFNQERVIEVVNDLVLPADRNELEYDLRVLR